MTPLSRRLTRAIDFFGRGGTTLKTAADVYQVPLDLLTYQAAIAYRDGRIHRHPGRRDPRPVVVSKAQVGIREALLSRVLRVVRQAVRAQFRGVPELIPDIEQEALINVFRSIDRARTARGSLEKLAYVASVRAGLTYLRKHQKHMRHDLAAHELVTLGEWGGGEEEAEVVA